MEFLRGVRKRRRKEPAKKERRFRLFTSDFKLRAVKLHLEEGVPAALIRQETGVSENTIRRWVERYRKNGEEGLRNAPQYRGFEEKIPGPVKEKIVEVKQENPGFGVRRISQVLRRIFFLRASCRGPK
jgi:transposase